MTSIEIHFKDGTVINRQDVGLLEDLTKVTVYTGQGERSVVPLVNVLYYDVEETEE